MMQQARRSQKLQRTESRHHRHVVSSELSVAFLGLDTGQMLNGARERVSGTEEASRRIDQRGLLPQLELAARLNTGRSDGGVGLADARAQSGVCRLPAAAPGPQGISHAPGRRHDVTHWRLRRR
ncbi:hypothetical protein ACGFMM_25165 [Streptomyces sp. NPDC048604]|uniref:hypothetical protein n=1 Tax=Streptomyces sp. NPDC048604 TaxID=3365578 RepID=UPI003723EBB4